MAHVLFARGPHRVVTIQAKSYLALILCFGFSLQVMCHAAGAQGLTGSIKGTVSATAGDASARPELLPGAKLILVNRDIPSATFNTVSDQTGTFFFPELPA